MEENQYPAIITQAEPNREPEGELVAYFENRQQLDHAMKRLSAQNFPMQTLFVVGRNITQVEYFGGQLTYPRVIAASALQGAFFGALIGLVTAMFTSTSIAPHLVSSVPLGIVVWVLTGLFSYSRSQQKGGGSFAMRGQTIPGTLEMRAHFSTADQARRILGVGPYAQQQGWQPAPQRQNTTVATPEQAASFAGPKYNRDGSKAGGKFGLRIDDPEEYARTVREQPVAVNNSERIEQIRSEQNQSRYGLRVDDPHEVERNVRKAPQPEERQKDSDRSSSENTRS